MKIRLNSVEKIIHYAPLYSAIETLRCEPDFRHIELQVVATESDENTLRLLSEEMEDPDVLNLYITSLPDIEDRLRDMLEYSIEQIQAFYDDCVLWTMLIDRTPVCIVGPLDKREVHFEDYLNNVNRIPKSTRECIACYPTGSTVDWFVNKSFNRTGIFEVLRVPFGQEQEFELVASGAAAYAVTLEPWLAEDYGLHIVYDIPIAPFGFTGLITRRSEFDRPFNRHLLTELVKKITTEIAGLYRSFEPTLFDWEMIQEWGTLPNDIAKKKDYEQRQYAKQVGSGTPESKVLKALHWMSSRRIWAMDPVVPLITKGRNFKSAKEMLEELLVKKEREKKLQLSSIHLIHQLKNEITLKVTNPIKKVIERLENENQSGNRDTQKYLGLISSDANALSDKFKQWLEVLNEKFDKDNNQFISSSYQLERYLRQLGTHHQIPNIIFNLERDQGSVFAAVDQISVPEILIRFLLDEIVGNSVNAYQNALKDKTSTSDLPPMAIIVSWRRVVRDNLELVELSIQNIGIPIPYDKLQSIGKRPTKSTTNGSGFGLYFLNEALQLFDSVMADPMEKRYFKPENLLDKDGNNAVKFTFMFKPQNF